MKELDLFYLTNCPYCRNAAKAIEALVKEEPVLGNVPIRRIEESQQPELTAGRDYYYVPTIFMGEKKLYEARPGQDYETIKENVRRALHEALNA